MIGRDAVTGIVLCGGAGSRFAGRDKPLVPLAGEPMVAHVVRRLAPQVRRVVVSCNRHAAEYARWADAVVADRIAGRGPLGGIASAFACTDGPWAFVCPGDAPLLSSTLVAELGRAADAAGAAAAVPFDGERRQPLFMVLRRDLSANLDRYLDHGGRSVRGWLDTCGAITVPVACDRDTFTNVNSPAELDRLQAAWAARGCQLAGSGSSGVTSPLLDSCRLCCR